MSKGPQAPNEVVPIVDPEAIAELTSRSVTAIYPSTEALTDELMSGRRLTVYMGIDPTGPNVHIGHAVQLGILERFRKLGHDVVLLIGGMTAQLGDPSGKSGRRNRLTAEQVDANAATYQEQASRVLNIGDEWNPVRVVNNRDWLGAMTLPDMIDLMDNFSVPKLLERREFQERLERAREKGSNVTLWSSELVYPMLQAQDSVALKTDVEVGGNDQTLNMLAGTQLVRTMLRKEKFVVAGDLLVDPDGDKMGKTTGNMITLNDPPLTVFARVMQWGDRMTPTALALCTTIPMAEIRGIEARLASGELSAQDGKKLLARAILNEMYPPEAAARGESQYRQLIERSDKLNPADFDFEAAQATPGSDIASFLVSSGLAPSNTEARRLLRQGGVSVDEVGVDADWRFPDQGRKLLVRRGKRYDLNNYRSVVVGESLEEPAPATPRPPRQRARKSAPARPAQPKDSAS